MRRGIIERVFYVEKGGKLVRPPRPDPGKFGERLQSFSSKLNRWLPESTQCTYDEFVCMYTGRRKSIYQHAVDSLRERPLHRCDAYLSVFLKAEKGNRTVKPDPAARVISPRNPRYNVEVGRFLKPLEHNIYRSINKVWGGPTVMKGYNAHGTAKELREMWDKFADPVAIGLDASRFDQHVSVDALKWEHQIYAKCFSGAERVELVKLLKMQLKNKCFARCPDGLLKYVVDGTRMSGDMNTALGNCLLMCAMVWAYCESIGIKARLANNGDDCVLIMERPDVVKTKGLSDWFLEMGFNMKIETPVDIFEHIEFCQTQPVWTEYGWVMVRSHGLAQAKDCHSLVPLNNPNEVRKWAMAVGKCGLSIAGQIPVQQEFYQALLNIGVESKMNESMQLESGFFRLAKGMDRGYGAIHPRTRYSYYLAFGVLPDAQEAEEERLRSVVWDLQDTTPKGENRFLTTSISDR